MKRLTYIVIPLLLLVGFTGGRLKTFLNVNIALILSVLLFTFMSCQRPDRNSILMMKAECYMKNNQQKAMTLIDSIPDDVLCHFSDNTYHNHNCIVVAHHYKAAINIARGNYTLARNWLTQLLENTNFHNQDSTRAQILDIYYELAKLETYSMTDDMSHTDSLRKSLINRLTSSSSSINHYLDAKTAHVEKRIFEQWMYLPTIILLFVCIFLILLYQYKEHGKKEICRYKEEISYLDRRTRHIQETTSEQLGIGKQIYETIRAGGDMKNISIEHEQAFINYFSFMFPQEYKKQTAPYTNLSLRHTTYLILKEMGYDDNNIQNILFVKGSTIRNYRLRINKHKKK